MRKALIYPFEGQSTYFFSFNSLIKEFDVVGAVSPNGWGLTGKDVGLINGEDFIGYEVKKSFDEFDVKDFDAVVLVDSFRSLDFNDTILKNLYLITQQGKDIIFCRNLIQADQDKIYQLCLQNNVKCFNAKGMSNNYMSKENARRNIISIRVPIIFVLGIAQRTQKFHIQLALRQDLQRMGYKISGIGSKNHCEIFGFHSFPEFMFSKEIIEEDKVVLFNNFVKDIEINENPDLIIIGIPGGIMPINKQFPEGFGILAYLTSQAVKPDTTILSLLYEDYNKLYYDEISKLLQYRLGCAVDCFNLSNVKFDYQESESLGEKCYTVIDNKFINKKISDSQDYSKPIFNIIDTESRNNLISHIIDTLANENRYSIV